MHGYSLNYIGVDIGVRAIIPFGGGGGGGGGGAQHILPEFGILARKPQITYSLIMTFRGSTVVVQRATLASILNH